jgi:hypothetical protein
MLVGAHNADSQLESGLRMAPTLTATALDPSSCKQSVPVALAIISESTQAAVRMFCPGEAAGAAFLGLLNQFWLASNSKARYSNHAGGHAAARGSNKPAFFRRFADWAERCSFSPQTRAALARTARCMAALIEGLLDSGYDFVMTARFQSDPLERRFGQYRQMSGGRFLVSLMNTEVSEKILKVRALLELDIDISEAKEDTSIYVEEEGKLGFAILDLGLDVDTLALSPGSRAVAAHVAGYIALKFSEKLGRGGPASCCQQHLFGALDEKDPDHAYIRELSRGGLKVPSPSLLAYVSACFAALTACHEEIRASRLKEAHAAALALSSLDLGAAFPPFSCAAHAGAARRDAERRVINVFLNNNRKIVTASLNEKEDTVVGFKARKRSKKE